MKRSTGGRTGTQSGVQLTDELLGRLADEAEEGFEPEQLRGPGRPRLSPGTGPSAVVQVRIDEELHERLARRAAEDRTSLSAVIRSVLSAHLD